MPVLLDKLYHLLARCTDSNASSLLRQLFSLCQLILSALRAFYQIQYLFLGDSNSFASTHHCYVSPMMQVVGVGVRKVVSSVAIAATTGSGHNNSVAPVWMPERGWKRALVVIAGAYFGAKIYQHISASSHRPLPPPPPEYAPAPQPQVANQCGLCKCRVNIPTLTTSGYIYCYACILNHLQTVGKYDPLTKCACSEINLIGIRS